MFRGAVADNTAAFFLFGQVNRIVVKIISERSVDNPVDAGFYANVVYVNS